MSRRDDRILPQTEAQEPSPLTDEMAQAGIARRRFLTWSALAAGAGMLHLPLDAGASSALGEVRATWVASVLNLDWPSQASTQIENVQERVRVQQDELLRILDEAVAMNLNTLVFQVKPCADALYCSRLLPWSPYLTGAVGKDPGFDPLAFLLQHAHARGIKVHAWLNPYRVSMNTRQDTIDALTRSSTDSPPSVYRQHLDWVRVANNRFVLDPGIPEVRAWLAGIIAEIVRNYPVDGIQFDDYFYYETRDSQLDDTATYQRYGAGFADKGDWRRDNTYRLIRDIAGTIKAIKPWVVFGISPAGVWRNKQDDPLGSDTQAGAPNYDVAYADTRRWVLEGLIDYIAPQIYWPFARQIVRYDTIARWWADTVRQTRTRLYIGMALYKVGTPSTVEPDWTVEGGVPEIARQLDLNEALPEIHGSMLFRHGFLREPQTQQVVAYLKRRWQGR
ncbi:glycoside hydrolase family 10 protein [Ralstonia solanacearum]|uniref:glycoside hydrolase family 10 protein n=1 Tax=Ralstonia solanacearum TaxID=305 RepID=UPI0001D95CEF|nr:glycoside hydrolase family 10 protein [Ralstonia solanacearum]CBJ35024.1 putative lipoprotein yddW precursor [Ralstonia solanacearum PSI07]